MYVKCTSSFVPFSFEPSKLETRSSKDECSTGSNNHLRSLCGLGWEGMYWDGMVILTGHRSHVIGIDENIKLCLFQTCTMESIDSMEWAEGNVTSLLVMFRLI